ncbi:lamin tail domain-containing protein [Flavobacteriales bacterium]|nr:lamin tail domain-containing protein [Flavobacteriales bacterium]
MKKSLLLLSVFFTISVHAQITDCTELFFSEYVEGWSQNKAIEVYNPTNATIDLSNYTIERYSNGATNSSAGGITTLTGMLASGDAFVLTNGETDTGSTFGFCDPLLISLGDMSEPSGSYPTPMHMNGNDAMVLTKNGTVIDVIGRVGEDPASGAWTDDTASGFTMGTWWTMQHTLIRKNTILYGDNNGLDLFNPSAEWDSLVVGSWNNLGSHTCDCITTPLGVNDSKNISYVMYPNPVNLGSIVSVNTNSAIKNIIVTNILGESVRFSNTINTNNLSKGIYIVNIEFINGKFADNKLIIE